MACRNLSTAQAIVVAHGIILQHISQSSQEHACAVLALHCCDGLVDAVAGPVSILVGKPELISGFSDNDSHKIGLNLPQDVFTKGFKAHTSVIVPEGGIWALVLKFRNLQQWGSFVGIDKMGSLSYVPRQEQELACR